MTDNASEVNKSRGSHLLDTIKAFSSSIPTGVGSFQHTLRQQAAAMNPNQHPDTMKIQMAIKAQRGIVLDEQALARESALFSKYIVSQGLMTWLENPFTDRFIWNDRQYLWGKDENLQQSPDLVDISDRLAFIIFAQSELQANHANKVEQARIPFKELRNHQNNEVVPRRTQRDRLANKIAQLDQKGSKKSADELTRLQTEFSALNTELASTEHAAEILKRTKLHEGFSLLFAAQKELGEKLAIISNYGELLLRELEQSGFGSEYHGQEKTAQIKGELSEALRAWSPEKPLIPVPTLPQGGASWLGRTEAGSFTETHGDQLKTAQEGASPAYEPSETASSTTALADTSPATRRTVPAPLDTSIVADPFADPSRPSAPLRSGSHSSATRINLSPTPVDLGPSFTPPTSPHPIPSEPMPAIEGVPAGPTIAETGTPIVHSGGPASGQLKPRRPTVSGERPISLASLGGPAFEGTVLSPGSHAPSSTDETTMSGSEPDKERLERARAAQLEAVDRAREREQEGDQLPAYKPGDGQLPK